MPFGSFLFPIPIQSCFPASEENVLLQLRESEQQLRESEKQLQESEAKVYAAKKDKEAATSETAAVQAQTLAFLILTTLSLTTQGRLRTTNQTLRAKDIRKPHALRDELKEKNQKLQESLRQEALTTAQLLRVTAEKEQLLRFEMQMC
eukprot:s4036_g8.t1